MKLLLSVCIAAIVFTGTAYAQQVSFGIKGGLNVSDIHHGNGTNYDPVVGFTRRCAGSYSPHQKVCAATRSILLNPWSQL